MIYNEMCEEPFDFEFHFLNFSLFYLFEKN